MFLFSDEFDDEKMADFFMLLRKVKQKNRLKITLKKETSKNLFLFLTRATRKKKSFRFLNSIMVNQ